MDEKEKAKRTNLMKLEAMSLFAAIRAQAGSERWWYFRSMRSLGHPVRLDQSLSAFRASLHWDYLLCGIDCQLFLEREAHVGQLGDDLWSLSISGIEGKVHALTIHDLLKPLQAEGYYIPNGNENLERQMNFSLGLYGACLMHVDVKFPAHQPPLPSALRVLDLIDQANRLQTPSLSDALITAQKRKDAQTTSDEEDDSDIIMGDWQTWK